MKILLVEPDKQLATSTKNGLQKLGCQVSVIRTAQSAIHAIDSRLPDVVLLELQIPAHNGIEFLYELRSYSEWQNLPVIIYTFIQPEKIQKFSKSLNELGVNTWLYKPEISLQQLYDCLQTNLAKAAIYAT
ncbi:MAG: response regulator [Patescibacteria group bacterium]